MECIARGRERRSTYYAWFFSIVGYTHLLSCPWRSHLVGAADTILSLCRFLPQTLLRSHIVLLVNSGADRDSTTAQMTNLDGLRRRVSLRRLSFTFQPRVSFNIQVSLWDLLHEFILSRFILPATPTYTYLCHRRANPSDPRLVSITLFVRFVAENVGRE